eukprot:gene30468-35479_t
MHISTISSARMVSASRRNVVPVRANLADDAAAGFTKIFSPPSSTMNGLKRPESSFSGQKHHSRKAGPFKDGFTAPPSRPTLLQALPPQAEGKNLLLFVNDCESEWLNEEPKGYKGTSKRSKEDGFHSKKL